MIKTNRLKKLAGIITEHHGKEVANAGEYRVELDGDTLYFYDGENTVRMEIPADNLHDIVIDLMDSVPQFKDMRDSYYRDTSY